MAYLILAHDDPAQLDLLIERLVPQGSPDIAIVHADHRSALWPLLQARWPKDEARVQLIRDPVAVRWGHWSLVAAMARLIAAAKRADCNFAHLLSGADWPLTTRADLVCALEPANGRDCFIEAMPGVQADRMQTMRFDTRWLRLDPARNPRKYAATWELRRLARWNDDLRDRLGLHRSQPWGPWRKGSQWWTLPADVLALLSVELPELIASGRLRGTLCADEHAIQTIVANRFADRLAPHRRFVRFPEGIASPRLLDAEDLPEIAASDAWFMRKVSRAHDDFFLALPQSSPTAMHGMRAAKGV